MLIILLSLFYVMICKMIVKSEQDQLTKDTYYNYPHQMKNNATKNIVQNKLKTVLKFLWYLFLFVLGQLFVILSMVFSSLPEHNIFKFNSTIIQIIYKIKQIKKTKNIKITHNN
eukprot:74827_1